MTSKGELLWALRVLISEGLADQIYRVREREGLGWEGPRVSEYEEAVRLITQYVKQEEVR